MYSPMTVSLVGRTTIGSSSSLPPPMGDDGQLGAEALDVLGLALEVRLRDEQREVGVLGAGRLDAGVDLGLHALPDGVAVGRITIVPRTGPLSASSALATTSWYQRGSPPAWG